MKLRHDPNALRSAAQPSRHEMQNYRHTRRRESLGFTAGDQTITNPLPDDIELKAYRIIEQATTTARRDLRMPADTAYLFDLWVRWVRDGVQPPVSTIRRVLLTRDRVAARMAGVTRAKLAHDRAMVRAKAKRDHDAQTARIEELGLSIDLATLRSWRKVMAQVAKGERRCELWDNVHVNPDDTTTVTTFDTREQGVTIVPVGPSLVMAYSGSHSWTGKPRDLTAEALSDLLDLAHT